MKIPPLKVVFPENDRREILARIDEVLTTGMLAQGKYVAQFEREWAAYVGSKHAVACHSGTNAIEIPMRALDVAGKEVLVPVNTFAATAAGVLLAGGNVRFVDADAKTFAVNLAELQRRRTPKTVGVIVVHIGGMVTPEIEAIRDWCRSTGLWLFEDAAHAAGGRVNGIHAGRFGIAASFSFFATKVMTTAEGGMIVTDDDDIAEKARLLRNHGKPQEWVSYHVLLSDNSRMSELNGILGLSQLHRLDEFIRWRAGIAERYTGALRDVPGLTLVLPITSSCWYKYVVLLPKGVVREKFKADMKARGVSLSGEVYELPLHQQPIFKDQHGEYAFPVADDICSRHVCLPLYPGMTQEEAEFVVSVFKETLEASSVLSAAH